MPEKKPEAHSEPVENHESWSNGLTLKRTRDGYSWTLSVSAKSSSVEDIRHAVDTAKAIDDELTQRYYGVAGASAKRS